MRDNFENCIPETLHQEGVNSNDKGDPGGATRFGITHIEFDAWQKERGQAPRSIWSLTLAEAKEIYKTGYWDKIGCEELPAGLDLAVFDCAVNNGVGRAAQWLLQVRNLETEAGIKKFCELRLAFDQRLGIWRIFGRGWNKRVKEIYARSVAMYRAHNPAPLQTSAATHTLIKDVWLLLTALTQGQRTQAA